LSYVLGNVDVSVWLKLDQGLSVQALALQLLWRLLCFEGKQRSPSFEGTDIFPQLP